MLISSYDGGHVHAPHRSWKLAPMPSPLGYATGEGSNGNAGSKNERPNFRVEDGKCGLENTVRSFIFLSGIFWTLVPSPRI